MPYLLAPIPYVRCLVRKEYLRNLEDGHGEFLEATAVAILAVRGDSLHFQVILHEPLAGCAFLLPIEALAIKPCEALPTKLVQPWDCFSSDIGVCEIAVHRRGAVRLLKDGALATYLFTVASTGTDLADDPAQRKLLHVVAREDGPLGAYPNNRLVFIDRALFGDLTERPDFKTLAHEFRAEGVAVPHAQTAHANGGVVPLS
ncbi:MAG TPA: hypothetical protein VNK48_14595 [Xanthobacteraceae bacterium]|nr:hypothetical protein [Xanthobacteraceae bacterium]